MGKTKEIIFPLVVGLLYSAIAAYFQWDTFSIRYSKTEYEQMYGASQYVLGNNSTRTMGDGDIYVYAGLQYLAGNDPTSINFEHPPLAKMFYGASYLITEYPNSALVLLTVLFVISFWNLTGILFKTTGYRLIALAILLLHSTIFKEAGRTMLDFPQATFILLTTVAFTRFVRQRTVSSVFFLGLSAGLLLLVKYPLPLVGIYLGLLFLSGIVNRVPIFKLIAVGAIVITTYCLGYLSYFTSGHNFVDFAKFEWWRWKWYQGKVDNPKFLIWEVVFLGKYKKWWEVGNSYVYFPHWSILWPITTVGYIISWITKNVDFKHTLFPYKLWILIALSALSLGAYEDRFLTPLIPGFILFGMRYAADIAQKWDNR